MSDPDPATSARGPGTLPWAFVLITVTAMVATAVIAGRVVGPQAVPIAIAGALMGLIAPLVGSILRALIGAFIVAALALIVGDIPDLVFVALLVMVLPALIGIEAAKWGGRSFTFALLTLLLLLPLVGKQSDPAPLLAVYVLSAMACSVLACVLKLSGRGAIPPAGLEFGIMIFLFETIGLTLTYTLAQRLDEPHAIWIAQMFVVRALAPPGALKRKTILFVIGVVGGTCLAALVLAFDPAPWIKYALTLLALTMALRFVPHNLPLTPGLFSLTMLLGISASEKELILRIEAALIAAGIALALTFLIEWVSDRRSKLMTRKQG